MKSKKDRFWLALLIGLIVAFLLGSPMDYYFKEMLCKSGCVLNTWQVVFPIIVYGIIASLVAGYMSRRNAIALSIIIGLVCFLIQMSIYLLQISGQVNFQYGIYSFLSTIFIPYGGWLISGLLSAMFFKLIVKK